METKPQTPSSATMYYTPLTTALSYNYLFTTTGLPFPPLLPFPSPPRHIVHYSRSNSVYWMDVPKRANPPIIVRLQYFGDYSINKPYLLSPDFWEHKTYSVDRSLWNLTVSRVFHETVKVKRVYYFFFTLGIKLLDTQTKEYSALSKAGWRVDCGLPVPLFHCLFVFT